jgi:hypothetical protein
MQKVAKKTGGYTSERVAKNMALLAPAAGGSAMAVIDVVRYQLFAWELDLSYYRQDGLVGRRERLHELVSEGVPARLVRGLRSRWGVRARRDAAAESSQSAQSTALALLRSQTQASATAVDWWEKPPPRRSATMDVSVLPGCNQRCELMPEVPRCWEAIRARAERPRLYCTSAGLVEKGASIFGMASSLVRKLPGYTAQRYAEHRLRIRAEEEAEEAAEREAAEAYAKAHPNLRHPPTLAPAYRDTAITEQARTFVYDRSGIRVGAGLVGGGAIAGLASSLSNAGTRKLNSLGPMRYFGGFAALGAVIGGVVDLTTRAGYEDAFLDSGEQPPRSTPWVIKPNKTFIMLAGTFGGYPASATFFNAYYRGATAARAERSASPLQTFPWVELQIDRAELERRHHELVVTQAWTRNDDAAVTDEIAGQRERQQRTTIEETAVQWSEEELGQFLTNIGMIQLLVVASSFSAVGWHVMQGLRLHPFFSWAFAAAPK